MFLFGKPNELLKIDRSLDCLCATFSTQRATSKKKIIKVGGVLDIDIKSGKFREYYETERNKLSFRKL